MIHRYIYSGFILNFIRQILVEVEGHTGHHSVYILRRRLGIACTGFQALQLVVVVVSGDGRLIGKRSILCGIRNVEIILVFTCVIVVLIILLIYTYPRFQSSFTPE